jgi:hypothetical protein
MTGKKEAVNPLPSKESGEEREVCRYSPFGKRGGREQSSLTGYFNGRGFSVETAEFR